MISNQILQTNIEGLKGITRVDLCICDTEGKILASTFAGAEEYEHAILAFVESPADSQVLRGKRRRLHGGQDGGLPDTESVSCV